MTHGHDLAMFSWILTPYAFKTHSTFQGRTCKDFNTVCIQTKASSGLFQYIYSRVGGGAAIILWQSTSNSLPT